MKIKNYKLNILAVSVVIVFQLQPGIVSAQEAAISPTPKPVEYTLPYPGLLPDHPLYFLRAMRDTMQTLFASQPLEKAAFHLLQADKGISASVMLADKKETRELAGATAVASQEHFEKSLDALVNAKRQGMDIQELTKKMVLANEKHQETLRLLKNGAKEHSEQFILAAEKAHNIEKKVKAFLPTK